MVDYVSSVTEVAFAFQCSLQKQNANKPNENYYQWSNKVLENQCIISESFLPHALCTCDIQQYLINIGYKETFGGYF